MQNLLSFLYRFRTFGLFLLLEAVCFWLVVVYNKRPNAAFFNSSNHLAASISQFSSNTTAYFELQQVNERLAQENVLLRQLLANAAVSVPTPDSSAAWYSMIPARVINHTYLRPANFLTLDAGSEDGVVPGMGVVSGTGVVGQVKSVSRKFSTVISLLHRNLMVSSTLAKTNTLCTTQWDGISPLQAELRFVPRHIPLAVGDSVVTSGFNAIFPPGMLVGTVQEIALNDEDVFYNARIQLAVDFSSLSYVYLVNNEMKVQKDSLEAEIVIP